MKTDSQMQEDVSAELQWEPSIHAAHIGVEVKDGVVTLAGQVDNYWEKWSAARAALRVSGVKAIAVELKVHLTSMSQRSDADIAQAVKNALDWTATLPADSVAVIVEGGLVTLSGSVGWQYQRLAAANSVRHLMGVTGVSNQISITPLGSAAGSALIKTDIEAALKRAAITDADNIAVAVKGSVVTLTGLVHDWNERDTAMYAAWGNSGVYNVVDKMTMAY
jgi:osmotically-inducible protein OsmY